MAFVPRFGMVTRRERQQADLFYAALTGVRVARSAPVRRSYATYQETPPRPPPPPNHGRRTSRPAVATSCRRPALQLLTHAIHGRPGLVLTRAHHQCRRGDRHRVDRSRPEPDPARANCASGADTHRGRLRCTRAHRSLPRWVSARSRNSLALVLARALRCSVGLEALESLRDRSHDATHVEAPAPHDARRRRMAEMRPGACVPPRVKATTRAGEPLHGARQVVAERDRARDVHVEEQVEHALGPVPPPVKKTGSWAASAPVTSPPATWRVRSPARRRRTRLSGIQEAADALARALDEEGHAFHRSPRCSTRERERVVRLVALAELR